MRTQSTFWPAADGDGYDEWDVHRLVELSAGFPVLRVRVDSFPALDTDYWTDGTSTPRKTAIHLRFVLDADPSYPIIVGPDGRLLDGMHRLVRALVEGRTEIDAVRFDVLPEPDRRNVALG